jgi:hypothetical protein
MSKLFSKVIIENIEKYNCNEEEAASLVDIYNSTVKKMATTLARRAFYELRDFASIRVVDELKRYKDHSLEIEKCQSSISRYIGTFTDSEGKKILKVIVVLEKN